MKQNGINRRDTGSRTGCPVAAGRDVLVQAQTGTGRKTLAFFITPMLQNVKINSRRLPRVLNCANARISITSADLKKKQESGLTLAMHM